MFMSLRYFFSCFFSLLFVVAAAQQSSSFHVQQFGTEEGLPSNGIKGLAWDQQTGFLWIATEAGIVRYNGMAFKTFTGDDDPHITNERILFLIRNNAGTIYTANNPGNIFSVKKNILSFFRYKKISGNPSSNVVSLVVSDTLYNADHDMSNGTFNVQFGQILPVNDTACILIRSGKVYYLSLSMKQPVLFPVISETRGTAFKCDGNIFFTDTEKNCWRMDVASSRLSRVELDFEPGNEPADHTKSFFVWENGMQSPVLFNKDKAWLLHYKNGRLSGHLFCEQIPQEPLIRYAQYDTVSNTLFIGTDSKGIIIIKKNKVTPVRKDRSAPGERTSYYSQVELPDGNIMTNEGNILGNNKPALPAGIKGKFSTNTLMQGDSVFWFTQINPELKYSCLYSYNFKTNHLSAYSKIRDSFAQLVFCFSGGKLYVANDAGVYRMQGDSLQLLHRYATPDNQRTHFDMKEIGPGILAIANCNALLRYDVSKNKLDTLYSSLNYCVRSIWYYRGYVFFGTYGNGLFISKDGVVKPLPLDKNHYLLFTHCFIDDGNGYCWISTNRGLFKANIADMINAYEKGADRIYYHYYGRNDGMDMTEMNGGCMPCGLIRRDKSLSFPTMEGLLWVNPVSAALVLPSGEIFIDEILVDNKRRELSAFEEKPMHEGHHTIQLTLGFAAWCNKENIYIEYKLNNNPDWIPVNTDNGAIIQLSNLLKGNYVLQIRKLNGFGINNYSYKKIRFFIPTPWYQRPWFYLLVALIVATIFIFYFRYRTGVLRTRQRKLEKQVDEKTKELKEQNEILEKNNSIKTRLISIISHDIVTPLKFVTVAGKNLIEKRKLMPEELQQETIKEMTNTSQELQLLSTNILNWIKYQNENRRMIKETFNLHEMVAQVLGILQSLARQKNLIIENKVGVSLDIYQYYEPLKILVYNLLTNAIHFTEKGNIVVAASVSNESIIVSVKDEGIGMAPDQIERLMDEDIVITSANIDNKRGHGLGYLIIKDLLKTMDATIKIESKKGEGATVFIRMEK